MYVRDCNRISLQVSRIFCDVKNRTSFHEILGDNLHKAPLDRSYKPDVLAHYPNNVPGLEFDENAVSLVSNKTIGKKFYYSI